MADNPEGHYCIIRNSDGNPEYYNERAKDIWCHYGTRFKDFASAVSKYQELKKSWGNLLVRYINLKTRYDIAKGV